MTAWRLLAILFAAMLLAGCDNKKESIAKQTGEAIGKQITDFASGVGKGIDQKMLVEVTVDPAVFEIGVTNTIAKSLGMDSSKKGVSVYFIASQTVSNTLLAKALNADGVEIGRAKSSLALEKDEAQYVSFTFSDEIDSAMVKKYVISLAR